MHILKNDQLIITVKNEGAELTSIRSTGDNFEYLWQGDPVCFKRQAPVLFPLVGKVQDDRYLLEGRQYEIEMHGFAKDSEFKLDEKTKDSLCFSLEEDESTLAKYPFGFRLNIIYRLDGNRLHTTYKVKNKNDRIMYFSIGAHPGFNCPMFEGEGMDDYYVEFEEAEKAERRHIENFLLNGKRELILNEQKTLNLSIGIFSYKAIIFDSLKSKQVTLKSRKNSRSISISFEGFPYFAIWSAKDIGRVVCLEPWYGLTSTWDEFKDFDKREGVLALEAGEEFCCSFVLEFNK